MNLNFSQDALSLFADLGFDYDPARMVDDDYVDALYSVLDDEDIRIGYKAAELEEHGLYPEGLSDLDWKHERALTEVFNKLAE